MTRPSKITTQPDIHALVDEIGADNALRLALDILRRETGSFVLFMRLGDDDPPREDGKRAFGVLTVVDPNEHHRLRETVADWLKKQ